MLSPVAGRSRPLPLGVHALSIGSMIARQQRAGGEANMPTMPKIPFNRPQLVGKEHQYIDEALASGKLSGNGTFARRCAEWLERGLGARRALITPSCTAALEMTGILGNLEPGDEVIVPDFAFVSTANAFALLGAVPVFVDIDPDTLNIDPEAIEEAVTERTRAIVVIHYGGVACDMNRIQRIADRHGLIVVEDAAHSLEASYHGRPLGSDSAILPRSAFTRPRTFNVAREERCRERSRARRAR